MPRRNEEFQTIHSEGGLLPPDLLRRLLEPKSGLTGTRPEDYGLPKGDRINEAITQSWNRLRRHWRDFQEAVAASPDGEALTGLTNERWSLPLLRELGFGQLPVTHAPTIEGKTYAISRFAGTVPIHLVGCRVNLDRRSAGIRGAASVNPHGLVQEFLNRSETHLWAIVSNGLRFRVLRDNQALSRQSYLEFDLDAMLEGEVYADFVLLWLVAHATRFVPVDGRGPESCILETWTQEAEQQGTRALTDLRSGVEKALEILGQGFFSHPHNTALREALRSGELSREDYKGQLLRVVYRLIFLFVAEDREIDGIPLLHPAERTEEARLARERYARHYSTHRLREMASRIKGSRHGDLWRQLQLVVGALSGDDAFAPVRTALALPPLGSFLWNPEATAALNPPDGSGAGGAELANIDLLDAIRHLAFIRQGHVLRPVDYRNLGSEELGGVYEGLLSLTPEISSDGARFYFAEFAGNERKTSGSYYTPDSLVQCLLDTALDPVVEEKIRGKTGADAEQALLSIKVCDPAVGSGHFLVGAAHRLARHLARIRALAGGESEPSPDRYQHALRDVVGHCLFGVDVNPMSAELCRVSLWLEALEPGKPLSFLDHHIRVGNSLLGATPEAVAQGIPDAAYKPIAGDDKKAASWMRKLNKEARDRGQDFIDFDPAAPWERLGNLPAAFSTLEEIADDSPDAIREKEKRYAAIVQGSEYANARLLHDAWCAAFVWPKDREEYGYELTTAHLRKIERNPHAIAPAMREAIRDLARQYQFFHWHLEFPTVFGTDGKGGFDVILGNPPWERVKLQEKEWFAQRHPAIANAPNAAARKRLIQRLQKDDPELWQGFQAAAREAEGFSHILRDSDLYPLCGRGDVNLYTVFAELFRNRLAEHGRFGAVLPSGIATDDTTKFYFQDVVKTNSLRSLFDFENRKGLFPAVDSRMKFCLFTAGSKQAAKGAHPDAGAPAEFAFFCLDVADLRDPDKRFTLTPEDIALLNPNTRTCPIFRSRKDAELTKAIYRRVPVLIREARDGRPEENPWGITFNRMFDMSNDSHLFRTREQLEADGWTLEGNVFRKRERMANGEWRIEEYLPLYEAKMVDYFDHRAADIRFSEAARQRKAQPKPISPLEKQSPDRVALPLFWVHHSEWSRALPPDASGDWLVGFASVTSPTNERTFCPAIIPLSGAGNSFPLLSLKASPVGRSLLLANTSAYSFDFAARQKVGGVNLNFFLVQQFSALSAKRYTLPCQWANHARALRDFLLPRVLELTYTAWDLEPFAKDCGWSGPPFRWDEDRRFLLRCELDAAFFHLYLPAQPDGSWKPARRADGCPHDETPEQRAELEQHFPTPRDAVSYIMDTFPIVKRKDEAAHGTYRTRDTILEIYDAMQASIRTGTPYQTRLDPPPGPPVDEQGDFVPYEQIKDNPPPHIHPPRGESSPAQGDHQLSDLQRAFPETSFTLRTGSGTGSTRLRVTPASTRRLKSGERVVLAGAKLTLRGKTVPAAIGKLIIERRKDADTGEDYVLVSVRGEAGIAQARFTEQEWAGFKSVGIVTDID